MARLKLAPQEAMKRAIDLARLGAGRVSPNPLVGCVILSANGEVIGEGYHAKVGHDHAEIAALASVQDNNLLKGAIVYVTLEPCAHFGRTPPCADRLAQLPIAKVVYGLKDPNPRVAGQGAQKISEAGIKVEVMSELSDDLEDLAEIFLTNQRYGRAFLAVKVATTLDGMIADRQGHSRWISGSDSRQEVHRLRGHYDAILVGAGTFDKDNPKLNIRDNAWSDKDNFVIVLDRSGTRAKQIESSALFTHHAADRVIWITEEEVNVPPGVQNWVVPCLSDSGFDWSEITKRSFRHGICSILIEGGAQVISSALKQSALDRWYQFISPQLMGGKDHLNVTSQWAVPTVDQSVKLIRSSWKPFGRDILLTGRFSAT